jgi:ribosomal protein S27AE
VKEPNLSDGGRCPYSLWKANGDAIRSTGILAMPQTRKTVELGTAVIKGNVCPNCGAAPAIRRDARKFFLLSGYPVIEGPSR